MPQNRAILFFSKTPQINRTNRDEPFAALPWEDLDSLFTAMLGDIVENACRIEPVDIILYRDSSEQSDDFLSRFQGRVDFRSAFEGSFSEQVQQSIDAAFAQDYHQLVVILDNHPLITSEIIENVFHQLGYEDDCIVFGPTNEVKPYLLGIKSNYSGIFSISGGNPTTNPQLMMERLCQCETVLFPLRLSYALDSGFNLAKLKSDVETLAIEDELFPHRTHEMFKMFGKKYKTRKTLR